MKEHFISKRINLQIADDGSLPQEIARTKSLSYSIMGLKGLIELSRLFNLGQGLIVKAIIWLNGAAFNHQAWPYQQVTPYDPGIDLLYANLVRNYDPSFSSFTITVKANEVINKTLYYLY
jgi:hypothetical protein